MKRTWPGLAVITVVALFGAMACQSQDDAEPSVPETMSVSSSAFSAEGSIPTKFSCNGEDISPPLSWTGFPEGTESFVLIADDPDAPGRTFVHWVYYDIPATTTGLPEGVPPAERPEAGGVHGTNGFGDIGYGGPCPPGGTHRYFFKLYALDTELGLGPGASKEQVLDALEGHALAKGELMGEFSR